MFALLLPSLLLAASLVATSRANVCDGLHGVPLITSDSGVAAFGSDWGAISYGVPACVAVPTSVEQVQHVIKYARLHGLQVTARGNGHSTGGQTLAANNIVIDTKGFDAVALGPNNAYVEAGVGAFWFDVVAEAAPVGKRPAAIVDTVSETTVGGVVSLGGTSAIALTNGLLVDAVISFNAVDAKGNIHVGVSATHEKALFAAVRGGSGQFAIVTSVRIRLVDVVPVAVPDGAIDATGGQLPAAVIAHAFVFADDALFANYVLQLHATAGAASVDGADIISLKNDVSLFTAVFGATAGGAIYGLVTSTLSPTAKFFHIVNVVDFAPLNPALAIPPTGSQPIGTTAFSWLTFAFRNVDQFARAHQSLAWYAPKATRVVFVPHDTKTVDLITKVLAKLGSSAEFYGDILPACQLSLKLLDTSLISATTLVRVPRLTRDAIEIGVICLDDVASSQAQTSNTNLAQRQRHLQSEIDALIRAEAHANWGAENVKAYSWNSQWECWHDHFGSAWPVVVALKQHYDPCVILGRGAGIFPQQRTRACSTGIDQPFECSFGSESSSDASTSDSIDSDDSKHLHLLQNALNVDVSDLKH